MPPTLRVPIQHKSHTAAQWADTNPVLLLGQFGYEWDNDRFKIGDGVNHWNDIAAYYTKDTASALSAVSQIGDAPAIYRDGEYWVIFLQLPKARGKTATSVELKLENADIAPPFLHTIPLGRVTVHREPRQPFQVNVSYRWRNAYRGGGSDGWSPWSAIAEAWSDNDVTENTPYSEFAGFDNDPYDGSLV
jgi:hypothetical protein